MRRYKMEFGNEKVESERAVLPLADITETEYIGNLKILGLYSSKSPTLFRNEEMKEERQDIESDTSEKNKIDFEISCS